MKFSCVICSAESVQTKFRNITDVSTIFFNLTSLELPKVNNYQSLTICDACYQQLQAYDGFRSQCLVAYAKLTQNLEDVQTRLPTDSGKEISEGEIKPTINNDISNSESILEIVPMEPTFVKVETCEVIDNDEEQSDNSEPVAGTDSTNKATIKATQAGIKTKLLSCQLCEQKFRSQIRYNGHLREHQGLKPALCSICGKDFAEWNRLKQHMANKHPAPDQEAFSCDYEGCSFSYKTKKGLSAHRKTHSPNFTRPVPKRCVCEMCGKTFSSSGTLKKHSYIHTGILPFHCTICDKKHPTAHKLKVHMMRHQGIKNYECSICGLKKITSDELKAHMNNHTKAKVYVCEHCGQIFASSGNMSRHVNIVHRGVKEFKCPHCERCFGKSETLKHHIMTHTGEKPHECTICSKRFIQHVALQTHMKTHAACKDGPNRLKRTSKKETESK